MNRNYLSSSLLTSDYNLYSEVGLLYIKLSDDNYFRTFILKGMVKDGIVYGDTTLTNVGDENNSIPTVYRLEQNYPNPFNPTTKIKWQSPSAGYQTLKIYDVLGNEVATLVNEYKNAGSYEVNFDASKVSSGIYFYQLQAGSFIETKKMLLLK
ncbi:MAG: T9SS type A sorting domain-containing protein [Ignavibacteriales bacterium]|nr:T9SS type A sorting domain-containing protein [Ignavibacteriales bacterium]